MYIGLYIYSGFRVYQHILQRHLLQRHTLPGGIAARVCVVQGYLAHKETHPTRTLP